MTQEIESLPWDSDLLELPVVRILPSRLDAARLGEILSDLSASGTRLAYWSCDASDESSVEAAQQAGGFLADKKVTLAKAAENIETSEVRQANDVSEYLGSAVSKDLVQLAIQAGEYSRFNVDPRIPRSKFETLYERWIHGSIKRKSADAVFVYVERQRERGFVTVITTDSIGQIGLFAVDESARRKRVGQKLMRSAEDWFREKGCKSFQVVTQLQNRPACRFYEKHGYSVVSVKNFYHFWIPG